VHPRDQDLRRQLLRRAQQGAVERAGAEAAGDAEDVDDGTVVCQLASAVEFTALLASQRRHGIDTCRAPRGHVARQQRSPDDESGGDRQDQETAERGIRMSARQNA